jgi:hypothetical protein
MHIHDTLVAARALIDTPETWAQGTYARDSLGNGVSTMAPEACCRCAEGAVCTALNISTSNAIVEDDNDAVRAFGFLRASAILLMKREGKSPRPGYHPDVDLNDGSVRLSGLTPHQAVMAMFDGAISSALEARV